MFFRAVSKELNGQKQRWKRVQAGRSKQRRDNYKRCISSTCDAQTKDLFPLSIVNTVTNWSIGFPYCYSRGNLNSNCLCAILICYQENYLEGNLARNMYFYKIVESVLHFASSVITISWIAIVITCVCGKEAGNIGS